MKKFLYFAFLLLTLLAVTDAKAQNYSSEMGVGDMIKRAWDNAQNSNADIYSEVYDNRYYAAELDYASYLHLGYTHNIVNGNKLSDYSLSSEGSSSQETVTWGNQNQNDAVAVGYSLTRVDGKYLKDNIGYRTISYVPPPGATMCTTIPQYYPFYQTIPYECVACASGTIANIMGYNSGLYSNYRDYKSTYWKISGYAENVLDINFFDKSLNGDPNYYYNIIHNIGGVPVNMTSANDVQTYIDNGSAVLGAWTSPSNYVELNPSRNYHMVTIVGYDDSNYYCIDPCYISPQTYPISDFSQDFYYGYPILP